jgi:hypothetical protein
VSPRLGTIAAWRGPFNARVTEEMRSQSRGLRVADRSAIVSATNERNAANDHKQP